MIEKAFYYGVACGMIASVMLFGLYGFAVSVAVSL